MPTERATFQAPALSHVILRGPEAMPNHHDLLAGMARHLAHNMGNPLAGLSLTLELLAGGPLSEAQQRLVERCLRVAERLGSIKENLGALGSAPAGVPLSQVDCAALCEQAIAQQRLPEAYAVSIDVAPGAEAVIAHPGLLTEALGYLLRNSMDAAPRGCSLGIEVSPLADGGSAAHEGMVGVRFTIWDTGPGMPAAFIDRLFVASVSDKAHGGGTGLISTAMIVQGIHRGRIGFEARGGPTRASVGVDMPRVSARQTGCRFYLDLPGHSA
jgi:signal transduction histidine kinase